jgi:hypothetical protein
MWSKTASVLLVMLCLGATPQVSSAQNAAGATYELTLRDGSRLYGTPEHESADEIHFRTLSGALITAANRDVVSIKKVTGEITNGEFLPDDPNQTRLFFGPTGRSLPRGKVYLGTYEFVMPFVQVGVTDRLSLGGGTPLLFGLDESERPFWISPKVQVLDTGKLQAAAGVFNIFSGGENRGIAYGVATVGSPSASVTIGAGLGYDTDGGRSPVVMVGGERRVRRNLKLLSENYVWEGGGILSGGVRFFGERLSADLGIAVPLGAGMLFGFPVVNFVYVF